MTPTSINEAKLDLDGFVGTTKTFVHRYTASRYL